MKRNDHKKENGKKSVILQEQGDDKSGLSKYK